MSDLPAGWRRTTLGGEAVLVRNGLFASRPKNEGPGNPILRISSVRDGHVLVSDVKYIEGLTSEQLARYSVDTNNLLFTRYNGSRSLVGISGIVGVDAAGFVHPDKLIRVVFDPRIIDSRFINYQVAAPVVRAFFEGRIKTTAGQSGISGTDLKSVPIDLPCLGEQQRIVDVLDDHLSRLDAAVANLNMARKRLRAFTRAAIDTVVMKKSTSQAWPELALEDFASSASRSLTDGPFGSMLTSSHYTSSGARVVRLQNIGDGRYKAADAFIDLDHYQKLIKHDVRQGDVVVASLGDNLPRAAVVPDLGGPAIVKADCIRLRLADPQDAAWVVLACRSTRAKNWATERLHGVGRQRLGMAGIREIPVPRPPSARERDLALDRINTNLAAEAAMQQTLTDATRRDVALRRALLTAAFSGRLTGRSTDTEVVEEIADSQGALW